MTRPSRQTDHLVIRLGLVNEAGRASRSSTPASAVANTRFPGRLGVGVAGPVGQMHRDPCRQGPPLRLHLRAFAGQLAGAGSEVRQVLS